MYGNNINAGSGGASNCSTNTSTDAAVGTCTSGYPKPAWQTGIGVPDPVTDPFRDIPDISLMSGAIGDNAAWLVCTDEPWPDTTTNKMPANCALQSDGSFPFFGFGGTSTAAPAFAGILAMVQQNNNAGRLGQAAKQLYDLYNNPTAAPHVFNDITVGNNSVYCSSGSPNCTMNSAGSFFLTGFDSTIGYDLASGLGSVDVNQLIAYWGTATGDSPVKVTVTLDHSAVDGVTPLQVTVSVTDPTNLGTPTGHVTISGGGYLAPLPAASLDGSGNATITIPAGKLAFGTDTITAVYNGDGADTTYSVGTGSATVNVTGFKLSATPLTLAAGAPTGNVSTITVTPLGGYAGTITLTAVVTSAPSGAVSAPTFTFSPSTLTFTGGSATAQTAQVTVTTTPVPSYVRAHSNSGIAWFKAAGGTTVLGLLFFVLPLGTRRGRKIFSLIALVFAAAFTIAGCGSVHTNGGGGAQKATPSVTVSPAKGVIATTDTLSVAVSVAGGTSTATGTVTLSSGSYSSSATSLASGAATITVPAGQLPVGTQTLTASYSGDGNFNSGSGTGSVKVGNPATTSGTYTVTVTGTGNDAAATTAPTTFTMTVN
jgi:hypothetical protein